MLDNKAFWKVSECSWSLLQTFPHFQNRCVWDENIQGATLEHNNDVSDGFTPPITVMFICVLKIPYVSSMEVQS